MSRVAKLAIDEQNPWPGLSAFDETAERFFNGRDGEISELRRLVLNSSLTVLFGASGLGKTSLIQAGLFPPSRKQHFLPIYIRLDFVRRKDDRGLEPLIEQVKSALERQIQAQHVEAPPFRQGESLWEYLHRQELELWSVRNQLLTPLFVFDQFEEVFTLGADSAAAISEFRCDLADLIENRVPSLLATAIGGDEFAGQGLTLDCQRYRTILSFREDYLPALEGWKRELPSLLRNRLRLLPMSGEQAFQAVHQTAPRLVNEPLAREIVRFVAAARENGTGGVGKTGSDDGELTVEPALLSLVCHGLNEKRKTQGKAVFDDELLAGSKQSIISDFYEDAVGDLPNRVREFIGNELITKRGFRKPCDLDDARTLHKITDDQINLLVDRRLLRIEPYRGLERIELTHDLLTPVVRERRDRMWARQRRMRILVRVGIPILLAVLVLAYDVHRRGTELRRERDQWRQLATALREKEAANLTAVEMTVVAAEAKTARDEMAVKFLALEAGSLGQGQSLPIGLLLAAESMRRQPGQPSLEMQGLLSAGLSRLPKLLGALSKSPIQLATFSQDGSLVTGELGFVRVWDPMSRKQLSQFRIDGKPSAIAVSNDGQLLGVSYDKERQGIIQVYKLHTGELDGQRTTDPGVSLLYVGRHGNLAAFNGSLYYWNGWSDQQHGLLAEAQAALDDGGAVAVAISSDESDEDLLALFDRNTSNISVLNLRNGRNNSWSVGQVPVADIVFDPSDQSHLASFDNSNGTNSGTIKLWDTRSQVSVNFEGGSITGIEFSPDGLFLAVLGSDGAVKVWDTRGGGAVATIFAKPGASVSLDGKNRIVAVTQDGSTQLWQIAESPLPSSIPILAAQITADGRLAAIQATRRIGQKFEDTLFYWNLASSRAEPPIDMSRLHRILGVLPGLRLAVGTCDQGLLCVLQFGNDGTTKLLRRSKQPINYPTSLFFRADGRVVAGSSTTFTRAGSKTSLIVWDIQNQAAEPEMISNMPLETTVLGFSLEGLCILRISSAKEAPSEVRLWDINKKAFADAPTPFQARPFAIAFSADRHWIATSQLLSSNPSARPNEQKSKVSIWRWPDGREPIAEFDVDTTVNKMSFSSDRRYLITAGAEAFIRVWDNKTGKEVGRVALSRAGVPLAMGFTDDDRRVVAFDQYSVRNAPWRPEDLGKAACERIGRSLSDEEWDQYVPMDKGRYVSTCDKYLHAY
jgi:WD40 repeat protein